MDEGREIRCAKNAWDRFEFWYLPRFTSDQRQLAIPYGSQGEVCLRDFSDSGEIIHFEGRHPGCQNLALSPDGSTLATVNWDGTLKLWDVAARKEICEIEGRGLPMCAVTFTPDSERVITGGTDETRVWDITTRRELANLMGNNGTPGGWMLRFHDRDTLLAVTAKGIRCLHAPTFGEIHDAEGR